MAKVQVEFDTVTKALVVTYDGSAMSDIDSLSFYSRGRYEDSEEAKGYEMRLCTLYGNKDEGVQESHYIVAKKKTIEEEVAELCKIRRRNRR